MSALPRQRHWRPRWIATREGETPVLDHLDRYKSGEAGGRKATKPGAHHRHQPAGSKPLPRAPRGYRFTPRVLPPSVIAAHIDDSTFGAVLEGGLTRLERGRFVRHLNFCPACRELLSELVEAETGEAS